MTKRALTLLGFASAAIAAWLGASLWVGHRAQAALQAFKDAPAHDGSSIRLIELTHRRGFFGAQGQADLALDLGCAAASGPDRVAHVRIDYSISHLVLPTSAARFQWRVAAINKAPKGLQDVLGGEGGLSGGGAVSIGGSVRTDMTLKAVSIQRSGQTLRMPASKGFLVVDGPSLAFGWKLDRLVSRRDDQAIEVKDMVLDLDLKNRHLGTGLMRLTAEQLSSGLGSVEGVSLHSEAREKGDRLDISVAQVARRLRAGSLDLSDLAMEMVVEGLDSESVETLGKIYAASCAMRLLTAEQGEKAFEASSRILSRGLSLGISKISGKNADGGVTGQLMLMLEPAKTGTPSLAAQFKSHGRVDISGQLMPAPQRELALQMGVFVAKDSLLTSNFEYADGMLKVNDQTRDASAFLAVLKAVDARFLALKAQRKQGAARSPGG
jgi:hypothetical protein